MADLGSQLNQLTPEQRQMVLARAQQQANEQVMQGTTGNDALCAANLER